MVPLHVSSFRLVFFGWKKLEHSLDDSIYDVATRIWMRTSSRDYLLSHVFTAIQQILKVDPIGLQNNQLKTRDPFYFDIHFLQSNPWHVPFPAMESLLVLMCFANFAHVWWFRLTLFDFFFDWNSCKIVSCSFSSLDSKRRFFIVVVILKN